MLVILTEDLLPEREVPSLHEVSGQVLEQTVLVAHVDQFLVALTSLVGKEGEVRVTLLAVPGNSRMTILQEKCGLGVIVPFWNCLKENILRCFA